MPELEITQPAPTALQKKERAPKGPSKLFTEYYGSAFLFLIAVFLLAAYVVLKPELDDIKETNAQTSAKIQTIASQRTYLQSLQQSVAAAQTIPATTLDQVDHALPDAANVPSLLVQFGAAASRTNVRIDSLNFVEEATSPQSTPGQPSAPFANAQIRPVDISLTLHTQSYFDVKRFLSEIESSLRLLDVQGITANGASGQVTYALQLRAYVFAPPGAAVTK
jgi:Tfp pilus assembly protein PilO